MNYDLTANRSTFHIEPLNPTFGAKISGVDLSAPLSDASRSRIWAARAPSM